MSEREFDTEEIPVIEIGTNNSQPLTTAEMAGVAAASCETNTNFRSNRY